jgi:hypothetical protein
LQRAARWLDIRPSSSSAPRVVMQDTISVNGQSETDNAPTINQSACPLHAPSRRGATSPAWKPTHYTPRPQPTALSNASNLPGVSREDPNGLLRVTCGSSYRRSRAINSTAMPATCASAAWRVACMQRAARGLPWLALVARTAERAAASTSP